MEMKKQIENVELTDIFRAIKTYQAGKKKGEVQGIVNAFARGIKEEKNCLILVRQKMQNGKKEDHFVMMKDSKGNPMFPIFTDMKKILTVKQGMEKQEPVEIAAMNLKVLFSILIERKMCQNVIINPFAENFIAPLHFFGEVMKEEPSSRITVIEANYMDVHADAIVCPTDAYITGFSDLEQAVFKTGGEIFETELRKKWDEQTLDPGDVAAVESNEALHSKYILFSYLPDFSWELELNEILTFYFNSMSAAKQMECNSIVFPCTSEAMKGMPFEVVIGASTKAVTQWLSLNPDVAMDVYFCCDTSEEVETYKKFFENKKPAE